MKLLEPDRKLFDSVQLSLELFTAASITSRYAAGRQQLPVSQWLGRVLLDK